VLDRETNAYLGEAGLFVTPMGPVALRYALTRAAWGRGLATEASVAVIEDAFGRLDMETLVAGVILANTGSIRVLEKLGFVPGERVTAAGIEFRLFHLARATWRTGQVER